MAFSINQVRHLFVASDPKAAGGALSDLGDTVAAGVAGQFLYIKHFGYDGVVASDKIDVQNIISAKLTPGANLNTPLFKHTVAVSTATAGQLYTVKVHVEHYIGLGVQDSTVRIGTYRAKAGATTSTIAKGLRIALRAALGFQVSDTEASEASAANAGDINNYKEQMFTVTGTGANIVISEVAPYWELGKFPTGRVVRIPKNGVYLDDIYDANGVPSNEWATITYASNGNAGDAMKKLADLEYFCMGARGDEYRTMGFPYNIDSKLEVNITTNYDVIDIHYAYVGSNESVQKSEKDLTILVPKDNTAFAASIDTLTGFSATDPRRLYVASTGGNG